MNPPSVSVSQPLRQLSSTALTKLEQQRLIAAVKKQESLKERIHVQQQRIQQEHEKKERKRQREEQRQMKA